MHSYVYSVVIFAIYLGVFMCCILFLNYTVKRFESLQVLYTFLIIISIKKKYAGISAGILCAFYGASLNQVPPNLNLLVNCQVYE